VIDEIQIGKVYLLPDVGLVSAYSFQNYADRGGGPYVFLERLDGVRIPYSVRFVKELLVEVGVEIENFAS
jgi:hypothetical protein